MTLPAPFEVVPAVGGYVWRLIAGCGRTLVYSMQAYPTDLSAAEAAKEYRRQHAERAAMIDGREFA